MKYKHFEDVPVWKDGIELSSRVFQVTEDRAFRRRGDVANQLQRAALSVPNNIAEGFERGTTPELITFLYYAKGSVGEVRSICHVIERLPAFNHLRSEIVELRRQAMSISRQIGAWAAHLQETDVRGQKYLTEKTRASYERKKREAAFLEKLRRQHEELLARLRAQREAAKQGEGGQVGE